MNIKESYEDGKKFDNTKFLSQVKSTHTKTSLLRNRIQNDKSELETERTQIQFI